MDIIKKILIEDINKINFKEKMDGRLKFNNDFVYKHPYLCMAMLASYFFVFILMWLTPYFDTFHLILFTMLFLIMSAILLFEIKPVYKFSDIGVLDLRVCYNGEWFFSRALSSQAVEKILTHQDINNDIKKKIKKIIIHKGEIDFYDIYNLVYSNNKTFLIK